MITSTDTDLLKDNHNWFLHEECHLKHICQSHLHFENNTYLKKNVFKVSFVVVFLKAIQAYKPLQSSSFKVMLHWTDNQNNCKGLNDKERSALLTLGSDEHKLGPKSSQPVTTRSLINSASGTLEAKNSGQSNKLSNERVWSGLISFDQWIEYLLTQHFATCNSVKWKNNDRLPLLPAWFDSGTAY